jgi:hypothetical protein
MRRYHVTIAGRFPKSSVDQGLAIFRKQLTQRGAWDEGLSGLREELGNVWLSVSSEFEAASPRAAVLEALEAYEDDTPPLSATSMPWRRTCSRRDERRGTTRRRTY